MANNTGNNRSRRASGNNNKRTASTVKGRNRAVIEEPVLSPILTVLITVAVCVLLFLSCIGVLGKAGAIISKGLFGIFGLMAYVLPFLGVILVFALYSVSESVLVKRRVICGIIMYILISILTELVGGMTKDSAAFDIRLLWETGADKRRGGGVIFGSVAYFLNRYLSTFGAITLIVILFIFALIIFLGRDALSALGDSGRRALKSSGEYVGEKRSDYRQRLEHIKEREAASDHTDAYDDELPRYAKKRRGIGVGIGSVNENDGAPDKSKDAPVIHGDTLPDIDKTPRINKKVSGVADVMVGDKADTRNKKHKKNTFERDDIHEITVNDIEDTDLVPTEKAHAVAKSPYDALGDITFGRGGADTQTDVYDSKEPEPIYTSGDGEHKPVAALKADTINNPTSVKNVELDMKKNIRKATQGGSKAYKMPPLSLLNKMESKGGGNSKNELLDTARMLQETLETFGVRAKVTDISQGPSVTRFELQPEVGVRVNKIVSLADDLKLSLAATDIRIEAPIPGKSAVGIEVPNKESTGVGLRELLEDKAFKDFDSKICFAVGKDIAGKTIVADIAKMPHMLIAGATGSGKSVCINTIIMSILYKAHPDDVKLIMVDPKVVELSVYNGIPHLMIPVVTDPKKAAAALNWGVAEMTERYKRFADLNVRDLKGYNKKIEEFMASGHSVDDEGNEIHKLPQIVIIVDELADLMMVAAKEVEESICRLAQLARACGIHLIIATQRPSVDVITGLIKANMPSRVAFAVSSGVDSRTILDMNGAEKLLGKGDMLFFPQGYPKPARVQGAFVSDAEVGKVVEFLKEQDYVGIGTADIENKISSLSSSSQGQGQGSDDEIDDLFAEAGRFIIAHDKASIGSLQRKFKIGFNRAARIMDQLSEAGVVGDENGTKAREILMSPDQFEQYVEEYI